MGASHVLHFPVGILLGYFLLLYCAAHDLLQNFTAATGSFFLHFGQYRFELATNNVNTMFGCAGRIRTYDGRVNLLLVNSQIPATTRVPHNNSQAWHCPHWNYLTIQIASRDLLDDLVHVALPRGFDPRPGRYRLAPSGA